MKFVKPIAKLGDIVVITKNKSWFKQTIIREASYREEFENKTGKWSYWVETDSYVNDNYENGKKYITMISEKKIKANLTTGEYYHKVNN